MNKKLVLTAVRGLVVIVVFAAIGAQIDNLARSNVFNPGNFFSFFTIESNVFGAVIMATAGYLGLRGKRIDSWRGAATLYMATTGIIYALLLARADVQTPLPWVNAVLHYIFPVVMVADWLIDAPKAAIAIKRALAWLSFPLAYAAYSLIRGAITGWYPYPFLNTDKIGYGSVAINCVVVAIVAAGLTALIGNLPRLRNRA